MSVTSVRPPGTTPPPPKVSTVADTPQERVHQAQKEAQTQIEAAQNNADRIAREKQEEADHSSRQSDLAYERQVATDEERLLAERNKGYERLRDLQRQNQTELNRVRREGEKYLADSTTHYKDSIYRTERDGESKLNELVTKRQTATETERKLGAREVDEVRTRQQAEIGRALTESTQQVGSVIEGSNARIAQLRAGAGQAEQAAESRISDAFHKKVAERESVLSGMDVAASSQIKKIRQDTAQKLAAYSVRQDDPFYKLLDTSAELRDAGEHFELIARIPEHEQQHVNVSVRGDRIVLNGFRRNQEELNLGPGRMRSSAAHQSYSESFPLNWPVNAKLLSKVFEGDMLIVRVPKVAAFNQDPKPHVPTRPEPVRAQRPEFPTNLPGFVASPKSNKPLG